jgi:TolA-binding protein
MAILAALAALGFAIPAVGAEPLSAEGSADHRFDLERSAIAADRAFSEAGKELWQIRRRIMAAETRLQAPTTARSDRKNLAEALKEFHEERQRREAVLERLEAERDAAHARLGDYLADYLASPPAAAPAVAPTRASFTGPH